MLPRKVKRGSGADEGQDSSEFKFGTQAWSGNPAVGTDMAGTGGLQAEAIITTHSNAVIHGAGSSFISPQFPSSEGSLQTINPDQFPYLNTAIAASIPNAFEAPVLFGPLYPTPNSMMSLLSSNNMSSLGNASNQGHNGDVDEINTKRTSRQATRAGNHAQARRACGPERKTRQVASQIQGYNIDRSSNNEPSANPSLAGHSDLSYKVDPNLLLSSNYNAPLGRDGDTQQHGLSLDFESLRPMPDFHPDIPKLADLATGNIYEDFMQENQEPKPNPHTSRAQPTPVTAQGQQFLNMLRPLPPANTAITTGSSYEAAAQAPRPAAQAASAHIPPNRISEAGPLTHPDPEWRPYGVNHWHVFLTEPTMLKYLSSTEIKDIREHCYELAQAVGTDDDPVPIPGSAYTTGDAQAVWRHCDSYVRRRGQLRNNQAARRSRQRKDAETRYWKALAIQYGAPDHDFNWDLVDEAPPGPKAYTAVPAAQSRARTRTRARLHRGGGRKAQAVVDFDESMGLDEDTGEY